MFCFIGSATIPPALVVEVRDAIRTTAREMFGKQEAAALEAGADPSQFSRDINGPAAVFLARLVKIGLLPKMLEKIGADHALKARLDSLEQSRRDHERRIADLEAKKEIA